jgi:hypothetical protein
MSIKQFTRKENIHILWDVVSDEENFRFLTPEIQSKVYNLFLNNIQGFYEIEKTKNNSVAELNKKYILLILNHIKKTYPYQPNKIKIHNEQPVSELITFEEIQNDRKAQFERDLNKRQEDFENLISIKVPPVPEFTDKNSDAPIKEMDKILKEMQVRRNYEVEQINRTQISNNDSHANNWLKSQETSLKNDKYKEQQLSDTSGISNKFRFLNQLDGDNETQINSSSNRNSTKSNVSWNNNVEVHTFNVDDDEDTSIFSKLKKVNEPIVSQPVIRENDRISQLELNVKNLNDKMDKILDLLLKR